MNTAKQNVIVISVNQYEFTDDDGKLQKGTTVRYLLSDNLTPCENSMSKVKGHRPAKASLAFNDYDKFQSVPAFYEMDLSHSTDSQGKVKLTPLEFRLLGGITVSNATSGTRLNLKKDE